MMATVSQGPKLSPERIFNALNAHQQTAALKTAIELDLFTAIAEGKNQPPALAVQVGASVRGVRVLCDYLTIQGFLSKKDGRYALSPEAALFLDRRSSACMVSIAEFLCREEVMERYKDFTGVVRRGGPKPEHESMQVENPLWVAFARGMAPLQVPVSLFVSNVIGAGEGKPCKVLDIAAGHGIFGITIARQNPQARIVALDWAPVLEVAKENARKAGVLERYETIPGSAFEVNLGKGYDIVLLTNFLHHFDLATCEALLRKVHAALKPGGRAVTVDFVPNEDRVSPPTAAAFSMIMLSGTSSGDAYTFAEYEKVFHSAGYGRTTKHDVPEMPSTVLLSEKTA